MNQAEQTELLGVLGPFKQNTLTAVKSMKTHLGRRDRGPISTVSWELYPRMQGLEENFVCYIR